MKTTLKINQLTLCTRVGWARDERTAKREVIVDIEIHFSAPPKACETDDLQDTICYDRLIADLRAHVASRSYRLIEHLCADLYALIQSCLPPHASVTLCLQKTPAIEGLGSVSFSL